MTEWNNQQPNCYERTLLGSIDTWPALPPFNKTLYLWTQTLCHPWLSMSALPGCSVLWRRWWRWGACRWGRSSGSSDPPRCCCCRGRWSAEWGRGPLVSPRSAGSPTRRVALWSDLPWGARWEDGVHLNGRWFCMQCMCGHGSEMRQRETLVRHYPRYRAMNQAIPFLLKRHQLRILRDTLSFLTVLVFCQSHPSKHLKHGNIWFCIYKAAQQESS